MGKDATKSCSVVTTMPIGVNTQAKDWEQTAVQDIEQVGNLKGREEDNKSGTQRKSVSVDVDLCSTKHGQYHKEFLLTEREAAGERDAAVKVDQSDNIRLVKEESKHTNYSKKTFRRVTGVSHKQNMCLVRLFTSQAT